jgi:hypothetical protein
MPSSVPAGGVGAYVDALAADVDALAGRPALPCMPRTLTVAGGAASA